ncbi:MAG: hypothetical protein PHQ05_11540 [Sterolibacterium sp.]|nr:hypothetical protein [Sterolibacterium sp.]
MQSRLYLLLTLFALTACEQLGLDDQAKIAAAREAEGRAIGNACRQTGRVLEECYALNPKYQKAAIFAGWRDMDGYMRENKIENAERPGSEAKSAEAKPTEAKSVAEKPKEANAAAKPAAKN